MLGSLLSYFTNDPAFTSYAIYSFASMYAGINIFIQILIIVTCNLWSRRTLMKQKPANRSEDEKNHIEEQKRKRNKKAAGILSAISVVYVLCTLPLSVHYILLGFILLIHKKDKDLFNAVFHSLDEFIHLPLFLCSGFNALVYMLKDKEIKKYYVRQFLSQEEEFKIF